MAMDVVRGDGALLEEIDLAPKNAHQEVLQNVAVILDLVQKSCPMLRGCGIPGTLAGMRMNAAENVLVGAIYDQIEEYEPRAAIAAVEFEQDALTGAVVPIVKIEGVREDG